MGIYKKILSVMKEIEAVPKDKVNEFHKYSYTSEAAVLKAVRDAMIKNGVIAIPSIEETREERIDGKTTIVSIKYCLTVLDTETGESANVCVYGQGIDSGDKAYYKAITGANKYALMKLFQIPSMDDPEADIETDRKYSQPESKETSKNDLISDAQRRYLRKLVDENNIDYQLVKDFILAKYGKESSKQLTKKEASELIEGLKEKGAEYLEDIDLEEDSDI